MNHNEPFTIQPQLFPPTFIEKTFSGSTALWYELSGDIQLS